MRHDPGLAASPPGRQKIEAERVDDLLAQSQRAGRSTPEAEIVGLQALG